MLLPTFFPKALALYLTVEDATLLLTMLKSKPADFLIFLECACEDEAWMSSHGEFMQNSLGWLTNQFKAGNIPIDFAKQAAKVLRSHFQAVRGHIPLDLVFIVQKELFSINSLLVGTSSDFFYEMIRSHWLDQKQTPLKMKGVASSVFRSIIEFMQTENVEGLWKLTQDEILLTLQQATTFELSSLMELCEACLKRYLNEANVIDTLKSSHRAGWMHLQQSCFNLINSYNSGISLAAHNRFDFMAEFSDFNPSSLALLDELQMLITHLICSSSLTENQAFSQVVRKCPNLRALDISATRNFSDFLYDLPNSIEELDLSMCGWLTDANLKKISEIFPNLKKLSLTSNTGITYLGWGELQNFLRLAALDISRCNQISDEDFLIILSSCKALLELGLEECRKLSEKAFFELAHKQSALVVLNLARSNVTDAALIEIASRCKDLISLNLSFCKSLTDRGVIQAVKYLFSLQSLKLARDSISLNAKGEIMKIRPKIVLS